MTAATARTNLGLGTLATQSGTFSGTSSGTNTGDQTITLTGDVTGSGTGSFAATIGSSTISLAKMADVATGTVFYRKTAATGAPEVQTLATLKTDLGLSGTNTGDQTTISGNAGTATALAADPADCAANRFANAINASGTLTCGQVDLTTSAVTGILAAGNGGTGNAFFTVSGPATSIKTFTLPNASATVLTDNALVTAAQGGTGNGFFQVSGPATSTKTFTFPNASDTVAVLGTAQTFTANNIFGNTNLWAKDIGGSFKLNFKPGSTLTADRTLTFTTGDADRTVTLNGNTTLSGTNTGDQTITLTSDVTGSGTGSFATTIANSAVTLAKMADMATSSVFYRKTAGTGAPEVQTLATLKTDLGLTGTNSGDQTISLTGDVTGSGTGSFAATIGTNKVTSTTINANAVTLAKMDASNATANKMLLSGASASPTWSTSTIPTSAGATANKVLLSDGTNYVLSTPTFPNASATSGKYIKSDGTNWIASTGSASGTGTCTNQVATVLNSDAAPTCASITNAMLGAASYSQGTFVATCSGTATSSSTLFLFPIGQISAFTCTITTATSGIPMPAAGTIKNLRFVAGTGGKAGDAVTILKNASATGMPTCTYGTATTCSDTSTSGSVAAGDLITVKIVTTTTDTTANVQVSFQLWN